MTATETETATEPVIQADPDQELRNKLAVQPPDSVEWLNVLVHSDPGAGKTYFCGTAADSPDTSPVLVFDVEGGLTTIRRKTDIDTIAVRSLQGPTGIRAKYNELYRSIRPDGTMYYKTVCIDSLLELASLDMLEIMNAAYQRNPENVTKEVPSPREWGICREHIREIVRAFRDLPCNVIYTAHTSVDQNEGQPNKFQPGFAGKLKTDVPGFMDIVGYLSADAQGDTVTRQMQFLGTKRVVAKDRTQKLGNIVHDPTVPKLWALLQAE